MDMLELWKCGYYICWLRIMFLGRNHWFPTNYGSVNIMELGINQSQDLAGKIKCVELVAKYIVVYYLKE